MAAALRILDGNPVWLSPAIVPSTDTVVPTGSSPTQAVVHVNSQNVFVYVQVENTGTVPFAGCTCTATGAWTAPALFGGFYASTVGTQTATGFGTTFTASPGGDSISGPGLNFFFGLSASGRRAWAWSPDGRFFAYVGSPNGNDWYLTILALQNITRSDGTTVAKGQVAASTNGLFSGLWTQAQFGWAGSRAVVASGHSAVVGLIGLVIACPEAPGSNVYGTTLLDTPTQINWAYLVSPCAGSVAIVPKVLAGGPPTNASMVSTATAMLTPFRKNNAVVSVTINGSNPTITTNAHTANGVHVVTGTGSQDIDDPECTMATGGAMTHVDRVKASTLPSGNLGVLSVGEAAVGPLALGEKKWVQVPNTSASGWGNQGQTHWCLLAQAYTSGTTIPKPWNGQAASPPAFPVGLVNCAQRNIDIL